MANFYGGKAPWVHRTPLGWAVVGITCKENSEPDSVNVFRTCVTHDHAHVKRQIPKKNAHDLDSFDVFQRKSDDNEPDMSIEDEKFVQIMDSNITIVSSGKAFLNTRPATTMMMTSQRKGKRM